MTQQTTYERQEPKRKSRAAHARISKRKIQKANDVASENLRLARYAANYYKATGIDENQLLSLASEALIIGTRIHDPKLGTLATAVMMRMRGLVSHEKKTMTSERRGGGVNHDVQMVADEDGSQKQYEDVRTIQPGERAVSREQVNLLYDAMDQLDPRERAIISERFFNNLTLEQVGQKLKLTRERIRQIESKIIVKLREIMLNKMSPAENS